MQEDMARCFSGFLAHQHPLILSEWNEAGERPHLMEGLANDHHSWCFENKTSSK